MDLCLMSANQKYNFLVSMDSRSYTFKGDQEFTIEKSDCKKLIEILNSTIVNKLKDNFSVFILSKY